MLTLWFKVLLFPHLKENTFVSQISFLFFLPTIMIVTCQEIGALPNFWNRKWKSLSVQSVHRLPMRSIFSFLLKKRQEQPFTKHLPPAAGALLSAFCTLSLLILTVTL